MAVFLNDRFLEDRDALLHVSDLSILRGYALFDYFRTVNSNPLFLSDHLNRFYNSASDMHLPVKQNKEELTAIITDLIKKTNTPQEGIRIQLTGGYSTDFFHPAEPNLLIIPATINPLSFPDFEKGYAVITYEYQRDMPHIKSINYQMGIWLLPLLKKQQANDVLYYRNNIITEFPRCNIFMVTAQHKLVTPVHNVLLGVTRKNVIKLAGAMMPVEERDITVDELMQAKEVFLTATMKRIVPILKINNQPIGHGKPGTFTTSLYEKFLALENSVTETILP